MDNAICTVLLFSYNHALYFARAIESVLSQKTQYTFKIHVFDDASTDGTSDLVRAYAQKFPDIITAFIADSNRGAQANIWAAYQQIDTKYFALLETDDYWCDDNKLDMQITALEENPDCSFCAHQTQNLFNDDIYRKETEPFLISNKTILHGGKFTCDDILNLPVASGYVPHPSSRVIRSSMMDISNVQRQEAVLFDNCQFYYLLLKGPMYFINKLMSTYNATGHGACSGIHPLIRADRHVEALQELNRQTDYVIGERIFMEMRGYINYSLGLIQRTKVNKEEMCRYAWLLFGVLPIYTISCTGDIKRYKLFGITILKTQSNAIKKKVKVFGIPVYTVKKPSI